jgi:membrane protein YdbS with pleckstrin-like domain
MKEQANPKILEIKRYFVRNPGALFILAFQALIFVCAFSLIQESSSLANVAAILAYCFLIVGVILQAISFIRYKESGSELR